MITPLEIENRKLSKAFRGYSIDEVNIFLDEIADDYEKLYLENQELKKDLDLLKAEVSRYTSLENTLKETLVIAKTTGEDIIKTARDKAEIIVADAELRSINDIRKGQRNLEKLNSDMGKLRLEFKSTKNKYQSFLQSQLNSINEIGNELASEEAE